MHAATTHATCVYTYSGAYLEHLVGWIFQCLNLVDLSVSLGCSILVTLFINYRFIGRHT